MGKQDYKFKDHEIKVIKGAFDYFDFKKDRLVKIDRLEDVIKMLGIFVEPKELLEKKEEAQMKGGYFDLDDLLDILGKRVNNFKYNDVKSTLIDDDMDVKQFKEMMQTMGDKLSKKELDEIMSIAKIKDGKIDMKGLLGQLITQ